MKRSSETEWSGERLVTSKNIMKKRPEKRRLRPEYDLSQLPGGARGKYAARYRTGTNLVLLSPDVAEYFPNGRSVNAALRALIRLNAGPLRRVRTKS